MVQKRFWELLIIIIIVGLGASLIVFNNQLANITRVSKNILLSIGAILVIISFLFIILRPYLK
jgi:hypothetical protein